MNKKEKNCIVGDHVEVNTEELVIEKVLPRNNFIPRPLVSNIDYLILVFSSKNPKYDLFNINLLILNAHYYKIKPVVVITKLDLMTSDEIEKTKKELSFLDSLDIPLMFTSIYDTDSLHSLKEFLRDKIVAVGGQSGVGKSSVINLIQSSEAQEIGEISSKLKRGKHTTRSAKLIALDNGGYVIDTPGFSSLQPPILEDISYLKDLFPEFSLDNTLCKYSDCMHLNEPKCHIKNLVELKHISKQRYDFYKKLYKMIENNEFRNISS